MMVSKRTLLILALCLVMILSSGYTKSLQGAGTVFAADGLPLRDRLAGTYSASLEDGMIIQTEIEVIGNIVFSETTMRMADGNFDYWLTEMIPDNPWVLDSSTETELEGWGQEFSVYDSDNYSSVAFPLSLTLEGSGLIMIGDYGWRVEYQRSNLPYPIHQGALTLANQLRNSTSASHQPSFDGDWVNGDGDRDSWLRLRKDGSFFFVTKRDQMPMRVFHGGYVFDQNRFELRIAVEQSGMAYETQEFTLTATQSADGTLVLAGDGVSVLTGDETMAPRMILRPVTDETWRFRADKIEELGTAAYSMNNLVGDMIALEDEIYVEDWGGLVYYSYYVPELIIDHPSAEAINREIRQNYADFAEEQVRLLGSDLSDQVESFEMNYQAHVSDDLLSLILIRWDRWSLTKYEVILYDLTENRRLSKNELLERIGYSETQFLNEARAAAENYFIEVNAQIPLEEREMYGYNDAHALTISDATINMANLQPFLDMDGRLAAVMPIASMAGPTYLNEIVYLWVD